MVNRNTILPSSKPAPAGFLVFTIVPGFRLEVYPRPLYNDIVIRLYMTSKNAIAHFHLLEKQQEEIDDEFGEPLEWDALDGEKYSKVSLSKNNANLMSETDWPSQYEWLGSKLERFNEVFRPRISDL